MFDTIKMLITDAERMNEKDYIEPHLEPCEEDHVEGPMPDYIKAIYTICRRMEESRDTYAIKMKYMSADKKKNSMEHFSEIDQSFHLLYQILMFETRSYFHLWDVHQILYFTGYRAGYQKPPDQNNLIVRLGMGIIQ